MNDVEVIKASNITFSEFYSPCYETGDYEVLRKMMVFTNKVRRSSQFGRVWK